MTDALALPLPLKAGKQNMAATAFAELRAARREGRASEGAELSFHDLIDTLNPLQHIPVVSEIYRGLTGDRISPHARVAGGALYGGPIGLVASVASLAIAGGSGDQGVGDRIYAAIFEPSASTGEPAIQTAASAAEGRETLGLARLDVQAKQPVSSATATPPAKGGAPMPQLSSEAFAALLDSFDTPASAKANPTAIAPRMSLDIEGPADEDEQPATVPADLLSAMNQALDKYEALKQPR